MGLVSTPTTPKAAALEYDTGKDAAPRLTAKGRGAIAEKIIALAKENKITLYEDADLVEILEKLEVDQEVPLELYAVVAEVFSFLYHTGKRS